MSASSRATDASSAWLATLVMSPPPTCRRLAGATAPPSAPATAASATTAASAPSRRLPNIPEFGSDSGAGPASLLLHERSPADMIMTLPRGASALTASALMSSAFSTSALSATFFGASASGISPDAPCPGTSFGEPTPIDSGIDPCIAATGSPCALDEWGAAGPTKPGSPLVGSASCSITSKSPVKVDYLVTFIACKIVTGRGLTKILGNQPPGFPPATGAAAVLTRPMLPCGIVLAAPMCRLRGRISRLTCRAVQPEGGGRHDHREMHQRI